jgi:hypothetical protein
MKNKLAYLILVITICFNCCKDQANNCMSLPNLQDKQKSIKGIIDSFYNSNDHGRPIILIKTSKESTSFGPSYFLDHSFFTEYELGDSLIKRAGFMDVILIKQDGQKKIYKYNCFNIPHDTLAF